MRAKARPFDLDLVWPALGNMTRRKPWDLGETYGESMNQGLFSLVQGVEVVWFWG